MIIHEVIPLSQQYCSILLKWWDIAFSWVWVWDGVLFALGPISMILITVTFFATITAKCSVATVFFPRFLSLASWEIEFTRRSHGREPFQIRASQSRTVRGSPQTARINCYTNLACFPDPPFQSFRSHAPCFGEIECSHHMCLTVH